MGSLRRGRGHRRARSHASRLACSLALLVGCRGPSVDARAIWIDVLGSEDERRIHVYDRGQRYEFVVPGAETPTERVRLGPRGRGVLVRVGETSAQSWGSAAWFDLEDGRRLPLWLPRWSATGKPVVELANRGDALWWRDASPQLSLIPLAPGVEIELTENGNVVPLEEDGATIDWAISALDASILLVAYADDRVGFLSYPDSARPSGGLVHEAIVAAADLPDPSADVVSCTTSVLCKSSVSLDPAGELALVRERSEQAWRVLDARTSEVTALELPAPLVEARDGGGLELLRVFDRSVSAWVGAGQLLRWDRSTGQVDSVPLFAAPTLWWFPVDRGRGLVFLSLTGPMYRIDRDDLEVINLETTDCVSATGSSPVVSPSGAYAAWTCRDDTAEFEGGSGAIVRVSRTGLERYVGVPMGALAIDDDGDLLVHSFESIIVDVVDGVAPTSRPRSLFVLSAEGVLSRVDELEPAPAPVLVGADDIATYMQGAPL